ncbi:ROK family transcriptional regulator [Hoyosella subflava]|uniref:Putative NagC family transcriptional regulator n=1 Tax=Hoyosella subflava (strain DSM 45089 / JCM 17490 / NBRC 109087 / DQS3-9A1) TaxID=443218 RepID=F6EJ11_HOYSD|nr:ROK family transcriptional regulator [Hoyosella subflava]AEF41243.1 Putative NagC family transcriptional regulator [Hoyosella subflava DQS3-9A1]
MDDTAGIGGPGSQSSLREANRRRVLHLLQSTGELTQADISRQTGLSPATVSNIARELTSEGVLAASEGTGRRRVLRLSGSAGLVAGIDFGHTHVTVAITDRAHQILAIRKAALDTDISAESSMDCAARLLDEAVTETGHERTAILAAGMGLPAPIEGSTGIVGAPSILPGWVGIKANQAMSEKVGFPVYVDNDANLGVLAEHAWGAGRGAVNVAYLKLSQGVGCGLVINGELYRGPDGTAGEIGHTSMDEFGAVCRCGNRGCLETLVASRAVVQLLEPSRGPLTIADVIRKASEGDVACSRVLTDTGRQVGVAAANLCNLFNPERIIIGGDLGGAGELVLAPIRSVVQRSGIPTAAKRLEVVPAELGAQAQVLGAIAFALQHIPSVS